MDADRLESWKEIAAYLRRDVRTVQRWEQSDGLPVHRHKRSHRSIPYAYRAELDAWWVSRSDTPAAAGRADVQQPDAISRTTLHREWRTFYVAVLATVMLGVAAYGARRALHRAAANSSASAASIAVLPFLDLSEGMKNEEFADGITEELIDRLNKVPGVRSPAPASVFYFKNKHIPVIEVAKALGVAYVLDGSVRKSGGRVRVAARLIRGDNANVVWSDSYERPWDDILAIQDDIAGELTKALKASVEPESPTRPSI